MYIFFRSRLLTRVHEVLKQCRDLKTDNGQKERRIDDLMEENGTLAAQVRLLLYFPRSHFCSSLLWDTALKQFFFNSDPFWFTDTCFFFCAHQVRNALGQLARAEEEVAKISEAHDSSQMEWGNRRDLLQRELSQALTDKVNTHFFFFFFPFLLLS